MDQLRSWCEGCLVPVSHIHTKAVRAWKLTGFKPLVGQDTFWCALSLAMCPVLNTPGVKRIPTDQVAQVSTPFNF